MSGRTTQRAEHLRAAASRGTAFVVRSVMLDGNEAKSLLAVMEAYELEDPAAAIKFCVASAGSSESENAVVKRLAYARIVEELRQFVHAKLILWLREVHAEVTESDAYMNPKGPT